VDRCNLRIHISRTVADTVSNSYGSEGWEFESLRARTSYGTADQRRRYEARSDMMALMDLCPSDCPTPVTQVVKVLAHQAGEVAALHQAQHRHQPCARQVRIIELRRCVLRAMQQPHLADARLDDRCRIRLRHTISAAGVPQGVPVEGLGTRRSDLSHRECLAVVGRQHKELVR
jgi:hypothetical protein